MSQNGYGDWTGLDWTGLGWAGLGWAGLGWATVQVAEDWGTTIGGSIVLTMRGILIMCLVMCLSHVAQAFAPVQRGSEIFTLSLSLFLLLHLTRDP